MKVAGWGGWRSPGLIRIHSQSYSSNGSDQISSSSSSSYSLPKRLQSLVRRTLIPSVTPASLLRRPNVVDPEFNVVTAGEVSLLHVKFPEKSQLFARLNSVVGMAPQVQKSLATEGGIIDATARILTGGTFFLSKFTTSDQPGDVLLAPKGLGDISTIKMDGKSSYFLKRNAYFASTAQLTVSPRVSGLRSILDISPFRLKVSGKGVLAITSYGGIFRLVLEEEESYLINPKHLIAWNSSMKVSYEFKRKDLYEMVGPGDFYLTSRLAPNFETIHRFQEFVQNSREDSNQKRKLNSLKREIETENLKKELEQKKQELAKDIEKDPQPKVTPTLNETTEPKQEEPLLKKEEKQEKEEKEEKGGKESAPNPPKSVWKSIGNFFQKKD